MTKGQWGIIVGALVFFLILRFGCAMKPSSQKQLETSRAIVATSTSIETIMHDASEALDPAGRTNLQALEQQLASATTTVDSVQVLKALSGEWFELGSPAIAGHYAVEVAKKEKTPESWMIAGSTYTLCVQKSDNEVIRTFCRDKGSEAFEGGISMDPDGKVVNLRLNYALLLTEAPLEDNPMKGILMLRELNEKYPENVAVLATLGRLAIKTGQFEKAIERLSSAWKIDNTRKDVACLLQQAYEGLKDTNAASEWSAICSGQ